MHVFFPMGDFLSGEIQRKIFQLIGINLAILFKYDGTREQVINLARPGYRCKSLRGLVAKNAGGGGGFTVPKTLFSKTKPRPRVPDGTRIYAIGDIHGRADLLKAMLERIDAHMAKHPAPQTIQVFLGDYVDRGPASREVLDRLIERKQQQGTIFLKGNHETYLAGFAKNPALFEEWKHFGGLATLMSYGLVPSMNADAAARARLAADFDEALPPSHRQFLAELQLSFTCGDFFFVHAGVRPRAALANQREPDLLWIREDFLLHEEHFEKVIVHGHTPVREPDIRANRINIDTGAYATGQLTCLLIERDELSFL